MTFPPLFQAFEPTRTCNLETFVILYTQWAAVNIFWGEIMDPPQICCEVYNKEACQLKFSILADSPPMMRVSQSIGEKIWNNYRNITTWTKKKNFSYEETYSMNQT